MQLLNILIIFWMLLVSFSRYAGKLRFSEYDTFKILQFTDLHFSRNENEDLRTMAVIYKLTLQAKPDLIIFTGDQLSGDSSDCHDPELEDNCYQQAYNKYSMPLKYLNQKYAIVLGNHDDQAELNRRQILDLDSSNPLSLTSQGPNGVRDGSNYYLPIYNKDNENDIQAVLWMFDTNNYGCKDERNSYGCVEQDQIDWFHDKYQRILREQNKTKIESLAFDHIPSPEYVEVVNYYGFFGNQYEGQYIQLLQDVFCPCTQNGFIDALMQNNVLANFCGHDHDNDFNGIYEKNDKKIDLHYGRKTGYGYYGPPAGIKRGGKLITLKSNKDVRYLSESQSTFSYNVSYIEEGGSVYSVDLFQKEIGISKRCSCYQEDIIQESKAQKYEEESYATILSLVYLIFIGIISH